MVHFNSTFVMLALSIFINSSVAVLISLHFYLNHKVKTLINRSTMLLIKVAMSHST